MRPKPPAMPGKPVKPGTRVDIMDKGMRVPDEVLKRAPGTKKGMTPPKGTMGDGVGGYNRPGAPKPSKPRKPGGKPDMPIGLPTPKKPVRVEKVDVRGVDGKPIKEQKPVLFGMAKGGAVKKRKK